MAPWPKQLTGFLLEPNKFNEEALMFCFSIAKNRDSDETVGPWPQEAQHEIMSRQSFRRFEFQTRWLMAESCWISKKKNPPIFLVTSLKHFRSCHATQPLREIRCCGVLGWSLCAGPFKSA